MLIKDIIHSDKWNESTIINKFNEYKIELKNRFKFNQPINVNDEALFFYKSKIHILIDLEYDDISKFIKKLKKKRDIYNKIGIINALKADAIYDDLKCFYNYKFIFKMFFIKNLLEINLKKRKKIF